MTTQAPEETTTRPNSPTPIITNHQEYYLPGGDLFIKVDNILSCAHAYFFIRESTIWRNILRMNCQGHTVTNPIDLGTHILCSITPMPESFAHFLWIFYNPKYLKYDTTKEVWTQIYTYVLNWGFNEIQGLCWREIICLDTQEAATFYDWIYRTPDIDPDEEDSWVTSADVLRFCRI